MSLMRSLLLAAAQNRWLRDHATHYSFVRGTVSRFMPGETLDDALGAAQTLRGKNFETFSPYLGKNIKTNSEGKKFAKNNLKVLRRTGEKGWQPKISANRHKLGLAFAPILSSD